MNLYLILTKIGQQVILIRPTKYLLMPPSLWQEGKKFFCWWNPKINMIVKIIIALKIFCSKGLRKALSPKQEK